MEETQAMMNSGDVHSEVSTESEVDRSEEIPEIVVDPVDDGREVSQSGLCRLEFLLSCPRVRSGIYDLYMTKLGKHCAFYQRMQTLRS